MFQRFSRFTVGLIGVYLSAQTQVDLRTQSKSVDFQGAVYTKPLRTAAALPATCTLNELLLLTTAPLGSNIYACLSANTWTAESSPAGVLAVQNDGTAIGTPGTANFIPGLGLVNIITELGASVNIQQGIDTSVLASNATLQSGQPLQCQSAGGSGSAYSCAMNPTLTAYTPGMILHWKADVNGTGGATTLNADLLGAIPIVEADGVTNPTAQDIGGGRLYLLWYDGSVFRLLNASSQAGGGSGGPLISITSTNAGGPTTLTTASEWHAPLAFCSGASASTLIWSTPPSGATAASAGGCSGSNVNDGYAVFANSGTPAVQIGFSLPRTLTGTADIYVTYLTPTASGTFTPALDMVCTPTNATSGNDPAFVANSFFSPGTITAPATANELATASAAGLSWPAGCTGGSRAHLRLIRTDTAGTAASVNVAEVVIVLRRNI